MKRKKPETKASPADRLPAAAPQPPVLEWRQALAQSLARAKSSGDEQAVGLGAVADACVSAAMNGNIQAMKEIAAEFERPVETAKPIRIVHTFKSPLSYW